eukprot:4666758-Pyramimonas_sp.AAC.1
MFGRPLVPYSVVAFAQVSLKSLHGLGRSLANGVQDGASWEPLGASWGPVAMRIGGGPRREVRRRRPSQK